MMRPLATALLLAILAACQSTGDITYIPTAAIVPGPAASVASVTVKDVRDEKPNRLATLRGLYGNPAKVFDTNKPVADEVAAIIISALQARFSDITDLVPFTQMMLNTAVDHLLDKPELRQVLNRAVQAAS